MKFCTQAHLAIMVIYDHVYTDILKRLYCTCGEVDYKMVLVVFKYKEVQETFFKHEFMHLNLAEDYHLQVYLPSSFCSGEMVLRCPCHIINPSYTTITHTRPVWYDNIHRVMIEKRLSFHIKLCRSFCRVANHTLYANIFHPLSVHGCRQEIFTNKHGGVWTWHKTG